MASGKETLSVLFSLLYGVVVGLSMSLAFFMGYKAGQGKGKIIPQLPKKKKVDKAEEQEKELLKAISTYDPMEVNNGE